MRIAENSIVVVNNSSLNYGFWLRNAQMPFIKLMYDGEEREREHNSPFFYINDI
jgi:hypothetical protein